ncbi:hypothetical protein BROUX41_006634 [Berkeleyomyces rouxiae]|uniref:uncharacterized protein n=1 Tax=Berkeleyomyces rouxiae TaxID=2035830 RepID=UPI003B80D40A
MTEKTTDNIKSTPTVAKVDTSRPEDFDGHVSTNDNLPPKDVMKKIGSLPLLDRAGTAHSFEEVIATAERTLAIFVRHFFCGNCQEYIRVLGTIISPDSLPSNTAIVIIGCGDPQLIDMYIEATGCKFPLYTDPERKAFETLGMIKTLQLGEKPRYMKKSLTMSIVASIGQALRQIPTGLALSSGDHRQVGGEFMFETVQEVRQVTWCHRMRSTRDHAELGEIQKVLKSES